MYTVISQPGDCLCSIARREGFSNCGSLRSVSANQAFLQGILPPGSAVTIPQSWNAPVYGSLAAGRRWTIRWARPVPVPQPARAAFVRTVATAPADQDAIADIGISRYITRSTDGQGDNNWVDHNHRTYDAASAGDPNTFNIEIVDPNHAGSAVVAFVEAMMPLYGHNGALAGHQRFPAGAERTARSLVVTCDSVNGGPRHRSCYLRLVVDDTDKNARPHQTLLVSDMAGAGHPEVELLDQDLHIRYEYQSCPRAAGDRCVVAEQTLPLRRGRSVRLRPRILRANRTGVVGTQANGQGDDGVIGRQDLLDRVLTHVRRIWAQEEIAFVLDPVETVDAPSDMLAISDPDGATSAGTIAGAPNPGQIGFTLNLHTLGGGTATPAVGPLPIPGGQTPLQTAQQIHQAVNALQIAGLTCPAPIENPAIEGNPQGSADVLFSFAPGYVTLSNLTAAASQDSAQRAEIVAVDVQSFAVRAGPNNAYAGSGMQRCLYKAFATDPRGVNVFVVQNIAGGAPPLAHTLNSQQHLPAPFRPIPDMENCIVIRWEAMDPDLTKKPATLAHEIGHALMDNAEHSMDDNAEGSLLNAATSQTFGDTYDTKRIIDWTVHWLAVVEVAANPHAQFIANPPPGALLWVAREQRSMHGQVAANARIQFTPR